MDETKSATAETGEFDDRRAVAAVSSLVLLAASVFLGGLALFGIGDVREFEFDSAYGPDPYAYAAVTTLAAVGAALFGFGLAWRAGGRAGGDTATCALGATSRRSSTHHRARPLHRGTQPS